MSVDLAELSGIFRYRRPQHIGDAARRQTAKPMQNNNNDHTGSLITEATLNPKRSEAAVALILDQICAKQPLPPRISQFLKTDWQSYLTRLCDVDGYRSQEWKDAIQAAETLAWSVQPKREVENRKRLYTVLPDLYSLCIPDLPK